ncbi:V-type proton ATPase 116 kDa subunit a 1-like [Oppia nitens]|uniref:V-type proton ATPase 116 kDa subunit a 1-like n=1 Tax=Oppia nitens TaxID=1686743 RepID=UPI0023DC796D|nr:V-type proton ATPase 116 kDa subunit a 1-like [Oppia nitens]
MVEHMMRSDLMSLCQLFLQSEAAYNCVAELGELGLTQFRDLNPDVNAFQRKFVNEVRRCDEMERKLRYLEKEIRRDGIPMLDIGDNPEAPQPREMIDLEATYEKLENELKEVNTNAEALKKTYLELSELRHILKKTQQFFDEVSDIPIQMQDSGYQDENIQLLGEEGLRAGGQPALKLGFVAGVILRERLPSFERMLWRVCRGNVFLRQAEIDTPLEDPHTGDNVYKSVFIIFFQGEQLKSRVKKICEGFRATLYPCPETPSDRREMISGVVSRIEDLNTVLSQTTEHRHRVLVAAAKNIKNWFVKVRKIKAVYHTLNMFNLDVTQKCLIAECWAANDDLERIQMALKRGTERSGSTVPSILNKMDTQEVPPTFNRTNKVTRGFQAIVDAYGVATYREMNPAPFTMITFPFLFAVMFGDAGHGLIMTLFGLWMVLKERNLIQQKSTNEIWLTFFNGRYIILMMGCFSIYTGFIYNDIFSKSLNIFGSSWSAVSLNKSKSYPHEHYILDPQVNYDGGPYFFGLDPVWQLSENKILFLNSYKMKLSVILGVGQMFFGVMLSLWNHKYFQNRLNIICEFIPQVIFLLSIFGYMNLMIVVKWLKYDSRESGCAPSILINLINMFLYKYVDDDDKTSACYLKDWYAGQKFFQTVLLLASLGCIPWMLFVKPYILMKQHELRMRFHSTNEVLVDGDTSIQIEQPPPPSAHGDHGDGQFDVQEVFIHQAIHTIEYCLGSISHTASYLRLWALSLAHAQLSEVLWSMVMRIGLNGNGIFGGIVMFFIFGFWAFLTVSVLLLMEGLSAFLHALRLHWVEFQSKFYSGMGYSFQPFSFEVILELAAQESTTETN